MVLAVVHGLICAARIVLDTEQSKLAEVCCARYQRGDVPIHAQSSRQRAFDKCPQHPDAIRAHRRSVPRGQWFTGAFMSPYRCWPWHQLICVGTTEVEDRHRTRDGEREWN